MQRHNTATSPKPKGLPPSPRSYRWTKVYYDTIQPQLQDWNMEDKLRSVVAATSGAFKRAQRVERRYQIGATASFRFSQLRTAMRTLWQERAPGSAQRLAAAAKRSAANATGRFLRLFESKRERRDRQLMEYRVGFMGARKWRPYSD